MIVHRAEDHSRIKCDQCLVVFEFQRQLSKKAETANLESAGLVFQE